MNLYRSSVRLILIALIAIGGSNAFADDDDDDDEGEEGSWTSFQSAEMVDFGTGADVKGGGILLRSKNAVEARLSTMGLDAGTAYTVWWVIFNKPSECSQPCGENDIVQGGMLYRQGIDKAEISVIYANGFVTGTDGVANVTAHLNAGKVPAGWDVDIGWKDDKKSGLKKENGNKAELHLVVRSHGPAMEGNVGFRTSNFDGSCEVCKDQQAIVFNPL